LKKRSKKLLLIWFRGTRPPKPRHQIDKSLFASFSSEKEESFWSFANRRAYVAKPPALPASQHRRLFNHKPIAR
jgi:hypothetical protein